MKIEDKQAQSYLRLSLLLFGDELDPAEVTKVLGVEATKSWRKGDCSTGRSPGVIRKTGLWKYTMSTNTKDLSEFMDDFLEQVPMNNDLRKLIANLERVRFAIFLSSKLNENKTSSANLNFTNKHIDILSRSDTELGIDVSSGPEG